jgi:hypothetical protein
MKNKFKTKAGLLTPYAFHCGYIQEAESNGINVTLFHEGGPLYHVRGNEINLGKRLFWESFELLTDARAFFSKALKA